MGSWTWKNSKPSKGGARWQDMKHDLHFLALPLNTFLYSDEKSPKRRRLVLCFLLFFFFVAVDLEPLIAESTPHAMIVLFQNYELFSRYFLGAS